MEHNSKKSIVENSIVENNSIHFKIFENEDHTLGGVLQYELLQHPNIVEFAGYKTPDPEAKRIELKLITTKPCTTRESDIIVKNALRELLLKVETMEENYTKALHEFEQRSQ